MAKSTKPPEPPDLKELLGTKKRFEVEHLPCRYCQKDLLDTGRKEGGRGVSKSPTRSALPSGPEVVKHRKLRSRSWGNVW